ncbi:MAG: hypothetical protein K6A36_03325 [Paludibacteraceae bacterium]|nr:hypothetical protein [Paludibacteraceae bacterium]
MKKRVLYILFLVVVLYMPSCNKYPTEKRNGVPTEYTEAWLEIYDHCYDSIENNVVALDLYSAELTLDKDHHMKGTGYNLYISDIFVSDSLLASGIYHSDTTAQAYTFLPGRAFEDTPTGMYLLYVENDQLMSIQLLDSGTIVVRDTTDHLTDLQMTFYYRNAYGNKVTYETHYQGALIPWKKLPKK